MIVPKSKIGTVSMVTQQANDQSRRHILETARKLFLRDGYDDTTTRIIAAEAHVSKATIYAYWKSKDILFSEVLGRETIHMLDSWLTQVEEDPRGGTIASIYRYGFLEVMRSPFLHALYTRDSQVLGTFVRRRGPVVYTPRYIASQDFVRALQSAGIIRTDLSVPIINHAMILIQVGLASIGEIFDSTLFPSFDLIAESISRLMEQALTPETPPDPAIAKEAIRNSITRLRSLILSSFPDDLMSEGETS
jgi:AcrR family transcriptional regulator